ncbi:MAG: cytochrome b/b6 domain-containing protein [Bryobacteraceae bacterium]
MTPKQIRRPCVRLLSAVLGAVCLLAVSRLAMAADPPADCLGCHDQGDKVKASAHATVGCATCHEKHDVYPHQANIPKPVCGSCHSAIAGQHAASVHGQEISKGNAGAPDCAMCHGAAHEVTRATTAAFKKNVPDTCGMCHSEVAEQFKVSVHGKAVAQGNSEAPVCTDCHGEHNILRPKDLKSSVNASNIRETCGHCHGDVRLMRKFGLPQDRLTSFDASFHGLAGKSGSQTVANCASCHGVHNILPSADPKSMINTRNLAATCGKCHPGAGTRFAIGTIHIGEGGEEPAPVRWARLFYLSVIPGTIGLMLLHHGGDWVRKLFRYRLRADSAALVPLIVTERELRMLPWERIQHALLAVSFITLAWTGFALKYPEEWWSRPLLLAEANWPVRGVIHRFAAVVMVAVSVIHVVSLFVSRRLRHHWLDLFPAKRDLYEGFGVLAYNLGLRKTKPKVSPHSYVEKVEYWAVVWGTLVMAVTGGLLWFNRITLQWMPKAWLDFATSVHFYEALLASLAILVWHFYTVIFDPDVYPMDIAWLTGRSVRRRDSHDAPKAAASDDATD